MANQTEEREAEATNEGNDIQENVEDKREKSKPLRVTPNRKKQSKNATVISHPSCICMQRYSADM